MEWNLTQAKQNLNNVVDKALHEGPQKIIYKKNSVIVMKEEDYKELSSKKKSLKELILNGPSLEGLNLERNQTRIRDIDL